MVAFNAVPTASARNWMQASVPGVGHDVTAVRLILELPVRSEFGAPGVTFEVKFCSIAGGNCWFFIGYFVMVWRRAGTRID